MTRTAYAQAGVDVDAGERAVALMRGHARSLSGEFASIAAVPPGMREPLVVSATDGVGTKTDIARRLGRYDTIGQDLVAMCADDIVCHGASPAFFLDYVAVGRVVPERVAEIVGGIAAACQEIGCDLLGGETAEHPGVMEPDEFDLAGFCVGSVELLTPTRLYSRTVLELGSVRGMAHVTGGGLARNLPRAVSPTLGILLDPTSWQRPSMFDAVAGAADMSGEEMRATFNCGIGFAVIVDRDEAPAVIGRLEGLEVEAWPIGEVRPVDELGGSRYVEA